LFKGNGMDELVNMAEEVGRQLKQKGEVLALAESCTGGMVACAITNTAGSSAWFDRGFVTYSNLSKVEMLGVSLATLDTLGAVSEQTAQEMALGALQFSQATIAGSITGIAGPSGGSRQKPVGTICFAWVDKDWQIKRSTQLFRGDRAQIRRQAAEHALLGLMAILNQ
jgi:nicotinamide-nucleotide amidase